MKFTALVVAATFALVSSVAAKTCCCTIVNTGRCDCDEGYNESTDCIAICNIRGSSVCSP
ncbi:hypothetical protein GQ607_009790 [Colletotrichum asianum]|uniref:Uncharacterized protein n=1 Tax=Colletotrichum asianum TaxID=702518 RepID=A0A8H3WE62_9PEZI|nr:hypothetical protein GQ607_009790 [Colletotrichum asianum]